MSDLTAEVRAALAAATPGPWRQSICLAGVVYGLDGNDILAQPLTQRSRNARLIASAPSWLAALCDRLDAAEAKLAVARRLHRPDGWGGCRECSVDRQWPYPCPTIQALNGDPDE